MTTTKSNKEGESLKAVRDTSAPGNDRPGTSGPAPTQGQRPQGSSPSGTQNRAPGRPAGANPADGQRRQGAPSEAGQRTEGARSEGQRQPGRDTAGNPRRPEGNRAPAGSNPTAGGQPRRNDAPRPDGQRRPSQPSGADSGVPGRRNDAPRGAPGTTRPGAAPARPGAAPARPGAAPARPGAAPARPGSAPSRPGPAGNSRPGGGGDRRNNKSSGYGHGAPRGGNRRPNPGQGKGHAPAAEPDQATAVAESTRAARAEAAKAVTEVAIPQQITVRELAEKMHKSPIEVIKALMNYGIMVPITQTIDFDTAVVVGEDLGIAVKSEAAPEPEVHEEPKEAPRTLRQQIMAEEDPNALVERPPVVTVLGHVDHGKTTLLDAIREARVVEGEVGGITQHIGAYQVERNGRLITFLDTPGHEAFTAMRARGASVTDIAVLVVAADDGVMPQTKEAIAHARAAQVPIVVALNKVDKANANPDRVKQELADNDVLIEEWGGDVVCVPVSAKMRRGIEDLLESILLVYDVEPARANPQGECVGSVIESRLDRSRGPMATLLVQNGTLHTGDSIVLGDTYGKIRAMFDDKGAPLNEAPPSTPAVVLGITDVPSAGDTFRVVPDEKTARSIAAERVAQRRADTNQPAAKTMTLENIFAQVEAGQAKELELILKADVQGSIEPIVNSLEKLSNDKVRVNILHQGTGNITESDVMLAIASKAIILGFSVSVDATAQRMAEAEGIDIRVYSIIYNLIEDVEKALAGMLEPVYAEVVIGHAEVRQVFRVSKVGKVAGCMVTDGEITRGAMARVRRNGQVLREDKITGLKRFQEDVTEVKAGYECGINLANFADIEVGDVIEAYKKERVS